MRILSSLTLIYLLSGCGAFSSPQFKIGEVIPTPQGCIDARTRGHDC